MNHLSASILSAALIAHSANATLGIACVDSVLVDVYDYINECRNNATCEAGTDYTAGPGASDASTWNMRNNNESDVYTIAFNGLNGTTLTDANTVLSSLATEVTDNGALGDMVWSEGLALGADSYTSEWAGDTSFTAMTTPSGTTTSSRAAANGTVSGSITETAFFYTTYTIDPLDIMRLIISNDSGSLQSAFFDVTADYLGVYNNMGASYSVENGCSMNVTTPTACAMVVDIVVTSGYTNASGVATCQPEIEYGGGDCDPDANGQAVYEAINEMRTNVATWALYLTEGDATAMVTFPNVYTLTDELTNADVSAGSTSSESLVRQSSNVGDAATAVAAATGLSELEWVGGLARAAAD
jgi:hypothetical protein